MNRNFIPQTWNLCLPQTVRRPSRFPNYWSVRVTVATDYDAPRKQDEENNEESIEELNAHRAEMQSGAVDEDENAAAESFELPGADLSNEELNVVVLPAQDDEFTCASCFLVRHRSQIAREEDTMKFCLECEG